MMCPMCGRKMEVMAGFTGDNHMLWRCYMCAIVWSIKDVTNE